MRVGISTASFFNKTMTEDAPKQLRSLGADICEVFLNSFCEYKPEFISLIKKRMSGEGVRVYSVHPMSTQFEPQLFSIHPRQSQDALAHYISILKAGEALGADCYSFHGPLSLNGAVKNVQSERIIGIVSGLVKLAGEHGIKLAWENVSWCLLQNPQYALFLKQGVKGLYFTLDVKQAARSNCVAKEFIHTMGDRLINVHLCDYRYEDKRIRPILPGRGEFDFTSLKHDLIEAGYSGPVFMELYSDLYEDFNELNEGYNYLKRSLE